MRSLSASVPASVCEHSISTNNQNNQNTTHCACQPSRIRIHFKKRTRPLTKASQTLHLHLHLTLHLHRRHLVHRHLRLDPGEGGVLRLDKLEVVAGLLAEKAVHQVQGVLEILHCVAVPVVRRTGQSTCCRGSIPTQCTDTAQPSFKSFSATSQS